MTTFKVNAIEPEGATTNLTIGMTGQNVVVGGSGGLKANTFKDAGGNTLWTSNGSGVLSSVSGFGGAQVLISSSTASNSASISFTSGLTSTYKEYVFEFININPATDATTFQFNGSDDASSHTYDITKTTTLYDAWHYENDSATFLGYNTGQDIAQGTGYQTLANVLGNDADQCASGELHLFNPSSTTYVKHFYATVAYSAFVTSDYIQENFVAGYFNTTAAITALNFKMSSGNFDGTIKMYGIK